MKTNNIRNVLKTIYIHSLLFLGIIAMTILSYHATAKIVSTFPQHQRNFIYKEHIVQEGDTLWKLAANSDLDLDPRIVVNEIMERNALTEALIEPGQVIYIPVAKSGQLETPEFASVPEIASAIDR